MRTEDGHIIQQCLDGDTAAFGLLVDKYRRSIYALAYSRVRDFHDAQDITMIITDGETQDGHWIFWIVPVTGDDPFPLKLDISVPSKPVPFSMSPDCSKLLFFVENDLWVVPVSLKDGKTNGPAVRVFSNRDARQAVHDSCSWSPDGTKLAVTHKENIWIVSAEGGEPAQITTGPHETLWPVWSPDGEMIAYTQFRPGKEPALMVVPVPGGEAKEISMVSFAGGKKYVWYPDGRELTFLSQDKIWVVDIASGKTRQIADLERLNLSKPGSVADPCWSPDGQRLVFTSMRADGNCRVFVLSADGGEIIELAEDDPGYKDGGKWSPDGKWISYCSDGEVKTRPGGEIWAVDFQELLSSQ